MANNAPGKHYRQGLSIKQLTRQFSDDKTAERWFINNRWPNGIACPKCGSMAIQDRPTRKPQPYRCRDCKKDFSVKTGTLMHNSPLGCQTWAIALYLFSTGLKGTSSMKLHRDLGVTQKTAWHLAHRIRESWRDEKTLFGGPVEADETFVGGKERNKHSNKMGLIRSRGRFPKGGYDVHHGRHSDPKTTASTVHGGVPGGCRAAGPR